MSDHVTLGAGRRRQDPKVIEDEPPTPPQPPIQDKLWRFYHHQVVGVPLMAVIVAAALFGVFGLTDQQVTAGGDALRVEVGAVERFRYRMIGQLDVTVTNLSDTALEDVRIRIDRQYLSSFSEVSFSPSVTRIDQMWWTFDLGDIPPHGARVLSGEVRSESFGILTGDVEVASAGEPAATLEIRTVSFP